LVSDLLRDFEFTAVLQIRRDAGCAAGMIANPRFEAGRFRPLLSTRRQSSSPYLKFRFVCGLVEDPKLSDWTILTSSLLSSRFVAQWTKQPLRQCFGR
jgi:hypothetical protein